MRSKVHDKSEIIELKSENSSYKYKYENNMLICIEVNFSRYVEKFPVRYSSNNVETIENISPEKLYDIYDTACIYLGFLLTGSKNNISDITNEQFLNSLAENDFFENCDIKKIDNLKINLSADDGEAYILSMEISYIYKDDSKTIGNLKSLITLSFITNEKRSVILKSINKEEL